MTPAVTVKLLRVRLAAAALPWIAALPAARAADTPPAGGATETIVLEAAHLFDSTGTALKNGATVVVRGERIVSVGAGAIPAGARVIDLGDATLPPGFIDAHTHLTRPASPRCASVPTILSMSGYATASTPE
jgi:hypothetical protein